MTLTKPSREAPLPFILLGGSEKGFGIFVDSVDPGSKATEAGLKRGDQVWCFQAQTLRGHLGVFSFFLSFIQLGNWKSFCNFIFRY